MLASLRRAPLPIYSVSSIRVFLPCLSSPPLNQCEAERLIMNTQSKGLDDGIYTRLHQGHSLMTPRRSAWKSVHQMTRPGPEAMAKSSAVARVPA